MLLNAVVVFFSEERTNILVHSIRALEFHLVPKENTSRIAGFSTAVL